MRFFLTVFFLSSLLSLRAEKTNFLDYDFSYHTSFFFSMSRYTPDEARTASGNQIEGAILHFGAGYHCSRWSAFNLSYGSFDQSRDFQKAEVTPLLLELVRFCNMRNNLRFIYGAGFGLYKLSWQPAAAGPIYTETDLGYSAIAGFSYLFNQYLSLNLQARYLGCDIENIINSSVPVNDRDINVSGWTPGLCLNFHWKN